MLALQPYRLEHGRRPHRIIVDPHVNNMYIDTHCFVNYHTNLCKS